MAKENRSGIGQANASIDEFDYGCGRVPEGREMPFIRTSEFIYNNPTNAEPLEYNYDGSSTRIKKRSIRDRPQLLVTEYGYSSYPKSPFGGVNGYGGLIYNTGRRSRPSYTIPAPFNIPLYTDPAPIETRHPNKAVATGYDDEEEVEEDTDCINSSNSNKHPVNAAARRYPIPSKRGATTYKETINSREAARRYGNFSRDTAQKYNGTTL